MGGHIATLIAELDPPMYSGVMAVGAALISKKEVFEILNLLLSQTKHFPGPTLPESLTFAGRLPLFHVQPKDTHPLSDQLL